MIKVILLNVLVKGDNYYEKTDIWYFSAIIHNKCIC